MSIVLIALGIAGGAGVVCLAYFIGKAVVYRQWAKSLGESLQMMAEQEAELRRIADALRGRMHLDTALAELPVEKKS